MQDRKKDDNRISRVRRIIWAKFGSPALLISGGVILALSILLESPAMAFAGLGLFFWGAILAYVRTEEYVKNAVSQAVVSPLFATLDHIIREFKLEGKAIYLPPKYPKDPETYLAFIPRKNGGMPPSPEQVQVIEEELFKDNSNGILLQPPGAGLSMLMEKTLGTSFTKQDLPFIQHNLPALFVDNLELAQDFRMEIRDDKIFVQIRNPFQKELLARNGNASNVSEVLGWTVSSAIACALAKAAGRMVVIDSQYASREFREIRIEYSMLKEMER